MTPNRARVALITGSIVVHAAIGITAVVSGIWGVERLDPGRRTVSLAVMVPPPPAPSGSPQGEATKLVPKVPKTVVKAIVQPEVKMEAVPSQALAALPGNGLGSGAGAGDNPDGDDDDTGTCTGPGCGPKTSTTPVVEKQPEVKLPPPAQVVIPPTTLKALRVAGETNLVPPDVVKTQMMRDDHTRVSAGFKVCIDEAGAIASVGQISPTGYPGYDATLAAGIRGWRYRPYLVNGKATPACAVVTFVYSIK
ncbi:MAG: hypothetical protein NT062_04215 [Proteobacteria bacterium]|nr:hypothetical protein [Pseudomonadota bacterium]